MASSAEPAGSWNTLLAQSSADTIFLRSEWLEAWRKVNAAGKNMFEVQAGTNDVPQAMASFYRAPYKLLGLSRYTILRPSGDCASGAEYPDWPHVGPVEQAYQEIFGKLLKIPDWDAMFLPNLADWNGTTDAMEAAARAQGLAVRRRPRTFAAMQLPATLDEYRTSLGSNRRSQFKSQQKALGSYETKLCERAEELPEMLEALFALNHRRWSTKGLAGTFVRKPEEAAFYREFAPVALQKGWLWLCGLKHQGAWAAIQYGYIYNGCYLQLQEGFDPEKPAGAGNVLRLWSIGELIARGIQQYDFLGEMTEHKRRWGASLRMGSDLSIGRQNLKNRIVFGPKTLWPTGRFLTPIATEKTA